MPVTTTALAILAGGYAGLGAYGSMQQAKAAKQEGEYTAKMLEINAGIADAQAKDALEIGEDQESRHQAEVRKLIGEQRVSFAGSGVDISSGSALDVLEDTSFLGELDRATIANNARREAWGFTVQGTDLRNRAKLARAGAANAAAGYTNQAYSHVIGGAATIGGMYRSTR